MSQVRKETNKYGHTRYYDENDKLHRDNDLPAIEYASGDKCWYQHGEHHRDNDLPAIEHTNGDKFWYQHGKFHRDNDLPAVECANGYKCWYQHDELHRLNGPAVIYSDNKTERYWINGIEIIIPSNFTEEQIKQYLLLQVNF